MPAPVRLDQLSVHRPDPAALASRATERLSAWDAARTDAERMALIRSWDQDNRRYHAQRALAGLRFAQDTRVAGSRADKEFFDHLHPDFTEQNLTLIRRILGSPHRDALGAAFGAHALRLWEVQLAAFDARIADLQRRESDLSNRYDALLSEATVELDGETLTFSQLRSRFGDADRGVRSRAAQVLDKALDARREALDSIYAELVEVRDAMGRAMGHDTYTPLGYAMLWRTDYGPERVAAFREQIRAQIVPLATRVHARRAAALGVSDYAWHDENVPDPRGVPRPKGDQAWMVEQAQALFHEMGDDFAGFFSMLREGRLMDLDTREGKVGGGFCEGLSDSGVPFIFANFNGTQDDVHVFTHECGHAFQFYSARHHPLMEYFWPTMEAAEIHSMSLELLTFPYMELFFGDDADRFRRVHLESAITFLPYGAAVDAFQHAVYAEPGASPERRAELWREQEAVFLPHRRYIDMPYMEGGRTWQRQSHIYQVPFYYIDYCLAQACAFQLWACAREDRADAMDRYRHLCTLGGSVPFTRLLAEAGLESPFDPGGLDRAVGVVAAELGLKG
ncbi:MAG: M3 family oligoendopeptidase [Alphaproteobacteria bacterium]|nr:M3 family oligoendopeptidase [Alphaproteobacteria bacterium]